jgi:hypothetical protein
MKKELRQGKREEELTPEEKREQNFASVRHLHGIRH